MVEVSSSCRFGYELSCLDGLLLQCEMMLLCGCASHCAAQGLCNEGGPGMHTWVQTSACAADNGVEDPASLGDRLHLAPRRSPVQREEITRIAGSCTISPTYNNQDKTSLHMEMQNYSVDQ